MCSLFAFAAQVITVFTGASVSLSCGSALCETPDWMYQAIDIAQSQNITVNATLDDDRKFTIYGSSLIMDKVTASYAGIYACGSGSQLYEKILLNGLLAKFLVLKQ